ncbi:hypothetical protein A4D02_18480 [Niastella koreensis]|uniref:Uncharacterized protein n=2 Tax=Niastella koreensis TaxID=354356 RepID=G8T945_NIAKG|nr:hypothetical protein Niako_0611 [Niastella koreensis GR20-10]OQP39307.1 hypothetical protein A4D02_18480 [Niastella koreensis]
MNVTKGLFVVTGSHFSSPLAGQHPRPASLQHFNKIYTASVSVPPVAGTLRSYVRNKELEFNNVFYFDNDFVSAYTRKA